LLVELFYPPTQAVYILPDWQQEGESPVADRRSLLGGTAMCEFEPKQGERVDQWVERLKTVDRKNLPRHEEAELDSALQEALRKQKEQKAPNRTPDWLKE
jgi:hypothetical protein